MVSDRADHLVSDRTVPTCKCDEEAGVMAVGAPVTAAHLSRIAALLEQNRRTPSEYSLANLFLYRHRHRYRFVDGEHPHLHGVAYDGAQHILPLCSLHESIAADWLNHADCIFPLDEGEALRLAGKGSFILTEQDADADYIYEAERLSRLDGAKSKRAQAARFAELAPRLGRFDPAAANRILEDWLIEAQRGPNHADAVECAEAISYREALGLEGLTVWLGEEPIAFLLAGPPRGQDRIVHFAKGRSSVPGVYPWMFSSFAARSGTVLLNFEQDLGKPGLAQAKRALAPIFRLPKFRLSKLL
jgi:hypothetical protein